MKIERYKTEDLNEIAKLFFETVHSVCARDYSQAQLDAWANGEIDRDAWDKSLLTNFAVTARIDGKLVGFGDVSAQGYLDRLYVDKDFQNQGIGTKICEELENFCKQNKIQSIETHSSITARSFFNKRDFYIEKVQTVKRNGIDLTNYVMRKS
ncbi:MAG: GNAT family N-acetyltransferase [Clostridia bacterium]